MLIKEPANFLRLANVALKFMKIPFPHKNSGLGAPEGAVCKRERGEFLLLGGKGEGPGERGFS